MPSVAKILKDIRLASSAVSAMDLYISLVRAFPLVEISSPRHHRRALNAMERLITYLNEHEKKLPKTETKTIHQYMLVLSDLIEKYERLKFKKSRPTGINMLSFFMDEHSLSQKDLAKELGGQSVVSEILNKKRSLNKEQIERLAKRFNVSVETFFD